VKRKLFGEEGIVDGAEGFVVRSLGKLGEIRTLENCREEFGRSAWKGKDDTFSIKHCSRSMPDRSQKKEIGGRIAERGSIKERGVGNWWGEGYRGHPWRVSGIQKKKKGKAQVQRKETNFRKDDVKKGVS